MLKHLITLVWNNRRQNFWLGVGLFVISICLWYAVDYVYCIAVHQTKPLGIDWTHVYEVSVESLTPESNGYVADSLHTVDAGDDFMTFTDHLRRHPAVESVCITRMYSPYRWGNMYGMVSADTLKTYADFRYITPDYFRVFRVSGADGTPPERMAEMAESNGYVINKMVATRLFPGKNAIGEWIKLNEYDSLPVSAVCENQKFNDYLAYYTMVYICSIRDELREFDCRSASMYGVYMRVRPEADGSDFIRTFRKEMRTQLRIGNLYMANMYRLRDLRNEFLQYYRNPLYTNMSVGFFFLLNAFFAVLGTFWSRTQQRRSELGLRIALGSPKSGLRQMLWGEGLLLLTLAFVPAAIVCYNLGLGEVVATFPLPFTPGRFFAGLGITYLLLAVVTLLSIWFPARQAMKVQPVEALRDE